MGLNGGHPLVKINQFECLLVHSRGNVRVHTKAEVNDGERVAILGGDAVSVVKVEVSLLDEFGCDGDVH